MGVHRRSKTQRGPLAALVAGGILALLGAAGVRAELPAYKLSLLPEDESVYAPPSAPREDQGTNLGGVNLDLKITYLTD